MIAAIDNDGSVFKKNDNGFVNENIYRKFLTEYIKLMDQIR